MDVLIIGRVLAERCLGSACHTKASTMRSSAEPRRLEDPRLSPSANVRRSRAVRNCRAPVTRNVVILLRADTDVNPALSDSAVGALLAAHQRLPYNAQPGK